MSNNCIITTYDAGSAPSEGQKRRRSAGQLRAWLRAPVRVVPYLAYTPSCLIDSTSSWMYCSSNLRPPNSIPRAFIFAVSI